MEIDCKQILAGNEKTTGGYVLEWPFKKDYWKEKQNSSKMELEQCVQG